MTPSVSISGAFSTGVWGIERQSGWEGSELDCASLNETVTMESVLRWSLWEESGSTWEGSMIVRADFLSGEIQRDIAGWLREVQEC